MVCICSAWDRVHFIFHALGRGGDCNFAVYNAEIPDCGRPFCIFYVIFIFYRINRHVLAGSRLDFAERQREEAVRRGDFSCVCIPVDIYIDITFDILFRMEEETAV